MDVAGVVKVAEVLPIVGEHSTAPCMGERQDVVIGQALAGTARLGCSQDVVAEPPQGLNGRPREVLIGMEPGQAQALSSSRICRSISSG